MGFFEDMFDPRLRDAGQLAALREHESELGMIDDSLRALSKDVTAGDEAVLEHVTRLRERVELVRKRLNRVELVTEALFMHLESQGQLDRKRLRALMEEIDARDGEADGRARKRRT